MDLKLTVEEAAALAAVLRSYLSDLRMEVADTERKRLRDQLKERERVLVSVLARLDGVQVPAGAWPYEPAPDVDAEV